MYTVLFILWPWYGNLFSGPGKVLVLTKKSYLHDEIASLDQTTSIRTVNCYHLCTSLLLVYVMSRCCSRSDLAGDLPVIISHIHTCDWVRLCHTCLWLTDFSSTCPIVPWVCPAFIHSRQHSSVCSLHRRRFVCKMSGSGSVRSSHQTVSHYTLRQWFTNTQQSRFMTACRCLEKLVLPSIFDTSLSSLMMWNLQSYPTTVLNERMWHLMEVKTYPNPSYIFSGVRTFPTPRIYDLVMLTVWIYTHTRLQLYATKCLSDVSLLGVWMDLYCAVGFYSRYLLYDWSLYCGSRQMQQINRKD